MIGLRRKSKIFLVNRDFQVRYARAAILVGIVSTVVTAFVILCPLYFFEILRIPRFLPWPILFAMVFAAFLNVMIVATMSLYATHRVAGPLFSLIRALRSIAMMELNTRLRLREGDEFHFVAHNFNEMADKVCNTLSADRDCIIEIIQQMDEADIKPEEDKLAIKDSLNTLASQMEQRLGDETSS